MRHRWLAALLGAAACGAGAQGMDPNARVLAATCAACHGTDGRAAEGSAVPGLAGMPKDQMLVSLRAFRSGERPATIMHQLAKGYSDAQIDQLATWFAAQRRER